MTRSIRSCRASTSSTMRASRSPRRKAGSPAGARRFQALRRRGPEVGQDPQGRVVADQPLAVPAQTTRHREEPDADDGDAQGHNRGSLGGAGRSARPTWPAGRCRRRPFRPRAGWSTRAAGRPAGSAARCAAAGLPAGRRHRRSCRPRVGRSTASRRHLDAGEVDHPVGEGQQGRTVGDQQDGAAPRPAAGPPPARPLRSGRRGWRSARRAATAVHRAERPGPGRPAGARRPRARRRPRRAGSRDLPAGGSPGRPARQQPPPAGLRPAPPRDGPGGCCRRRWRRRDAGAGAPRRSAAARRPGRASRGRRRRPSRFRCRAAETEQDGQQGRLAAPAGAGHERAPRRVPR